MFAFLTVDQSHVVSLVVNSLAVGGGFLAGYMLFGLLAFLLDRWLFLSKTPVGVHRIVRMLGGVALAVLVALFVFGDGSGKGGGGTGEGPGQQANGEGTGSTVSPATTPTSAKIPDPPPPVSSNDPTVTWVRITLLGGDDVKEEKFYLIDDDRTPKNFAEVTALVKGKKDTAGKPLGIEYRFSPNNTLPRTHPAILRLANWSEANGVKFSSSVPKP